MKPLSRFVSNAAARGLSRLQGWRQTSSWQRYARAQHGRKSALPRRLAADLALLGVATMIPLAILFWSRESEQQQLARLPLEPTRYAYGWTMSQTQSHVFFDTLSPAARAPSSSQTSDEASSASLLTLWSIRCGQLYETLLSRRPPSEQEARARRTKRLQCVEGAQVTTRGASLSTKRLDYENRTQGYRLTTDRPVVVQKGENRLSSLGGGIVEERGELRLFHNISFEAPRLNIAAQGELLGENLLTGNLLSKNKRRTVVFKRDVAFSFQASSRRYRGSSQEMKLLICSMPSKVVCRVFGSDALERIVLRGSVVVAEEGGEGLAWTLQAERVVVQDEQARYEGTKHRGRYDKARILLADGTELRGRRGGHELADDSGLMCGAVEVRNGEGVLAGACLRYNLTEQRYSLESSASERELARRFFAL